MAAWYHGGRLINDDPHYYLLVSGSVSPPFQGKSRLIAAARTGLIAAAKNGANIMFSASSPGLTPSRPARPICRRREPLHWQTRDM
jgi:hypothetical protein